MADYKIKNITVRQKIATGDDTYIVCGNSDYTVHWDLDDEWSEYSEKTMLVVLDSGEAYSIQFTGTDTALPALPNTRRCVIGLMAGDVRTTTGAMFVCRPSVRDASGAPVEPPADVYAQLAAQLAGKISEPSEDGTAGQALITDGKGGRSWGDVASAPDWNQNDPTAKDYVKNRTHYVEKDANVVCLPEAEITVADGSITSVFPAATAVPELGAEATVIFDGVTYTGTWLSWDGTEQGDDAYFGNRHLWGDDMTDTGEPFCVNIWDDNDPQLDLALSASDGTHTISATAKQDVVHTIDPKFIKDMYYTEKRRVGGVGFNGWIAVTNWEAEPIPELVITGTVYTNVEVSDYSSTEVNYKAGGYTLNFSRRNAALTIFPLDSGLSDSDVEVYGWHVVYHQIPDRYIPGWMVDTLNNIVTPVQADWNQTNTSDLSFIKNKPDLGVNLFNNYVDTTLLLSSDAYILAASTKPFRVIYRDGKIPKVRFRNLNSNIVDIISPKTGEPMTVEEYPYAMMFVWNWGDTPYCLNPLGSDGITPHIGDNGNWYLGDTDTGVAAQGPAGSDASVTAANIQTALGYVPAASGLGVTGAAAGNLLKIAAVDANGVPTKIGTGNAVSAVAPAFAADTAAMTDTSKVYIGANGHLWAYQQSTEQQATAENVFSKSGVQLNVRLKSNGVDTSAQTGMAVSDFIPVDLNADPFWVWFKGWNLKASEAWSLYTKVYYYDASKAYLGGYDMSIPPATLNKINMIEDGDYKKFKAGYAETTDMDASTEAKLSFYSNIKYIRFNMLVVPGGSSPAAATDANLNGIEIYLNQNPNETTEVVTNAWVDTGITYAQTALTQADKEAIAEIVLEQLGSPYVTAANVLEMPESGTVVYADTNGTLADTEPIGEV